jgi:secondary thiamine-phosphate synthase enzyme
MIRLIKEKNMKWYKNTLSIQTDGRGFYDITDKVNGFVRESGIKDGIAFIFLQHTSASLIINENYAASARRDMENFLEELAPEGETWYRHTSEGTDDSPSHLRTIITHTNLTIPVDDGEMSLGTWQGIFLAEHRRRGHQRRILIHLLSVNQD